MPRLRQFAVCLAGTQRGLGGFSAGDRLPRIGGMIGGITRRRFLLRAAGLVVAPALAAHAMPIPSGPFRLRLLDAHTGATFDGVYRDDSGPMAQVMEELSAFLRDHHSGRVTDIDVGVIDFLA